MNYTVSYSENKNMITLYQSPIKSAMFQCKCISDFFLYTYLLSNFFFLKSVKSSCFI